MNLQRPVVDPEGSSLVSRAETAAGLRRVGGPSQRVLRKQEMERRLHALSLRHALLDRMLLTENRGPFRNGFVIQRLKRLKLRVKDEMATLEGMLRTVCGPDLVRRAAR